MRPTERCVYCRQRPVEAAWRPFCSERCKMADLGRWLGEHYRVPGSTVTPPGSSDTADADEEPFNGESDDEMREGSGRRWPRR